MRPAGRLLRTVAAAPARRGGASAAAAPAAAAKTAGSWEKLNEKPERPRGQVSRFPPEGGGLKLSIDEALYLAKEAGFYTTEEIQLQIVRSPPFSPRERPFLIENFYDVVDDVPSDRRDSQSGELSSEEEGDEEADMVHPAIHAAIQKYFRPGEPPKFWHRGEEWLSMAEGRGTMKRASAHAVIVRGSGIFKVNGESDMFSWWPLLYNRFDVCQPFKLSGTAGVYDVFAHRGFCLLEDTRQKMSKMPGKAGARKSFPWTKR